MFNAFIVICVSSVQCMSATNTHNNGMYPTMEQCEARLEEMKPVLRSFVPGKITVAECRKLKGKGEPA